jgi:hypothetical protein
MLKDGRLVVFFDVDDTLIIPACATGFPVDTPNYENIAVYKWFQKQGCWMGIWSGGGKDYAKHWAKKMGLVADEYMNKKDLNRREDVDIAVDDCEISLAKVNVRVSRINNKVNRKEWVESQGITIEEHNKSKMEYDEPRVE